MKLVVGLGNPGKEYENTRHNSGFLFIDELARRWKLDGFVYEKKFLSEITEAEFPIFKSQFPKKSQISKSKLILAKPQTFMNKSGVAATALAKFYKIKPKDIWVIHDDIDILWGEFKTSFGRSSAGHKGVESIIRVLKTKDFWRVRIGIQPTLKKHTPAEKIILKKFTPTEQKVLSNTIKKAISQLEMTLENL